jgi:hypothetical protein
MFLTDTNTPACWGEEVGKFSSDPAARERDLTPLSIEE